MRVSELVSLPAAATLALREPRGLSKVTIELIGARATRVRVIASDRARELWTTFRASNRNLFPWTDEDAARLAATMLRRAREDVDALVAKTTSRPVGEDAYVVVIDAAGVSRAEAEARAKELVTGSAWNVDARAVKTSVAFNATGLLRALEALVAVRERVNPMTSVETTLLFEAKQEIAAANGGRS